MRNQNILDMTEGENHVVNLNSLVANFIHLLTYSLFYVKGKALITVVH